MVKKKSYKIKQEILYWLSKTDFKKKKITLKNINKISNNFIESLKNKCKKLSGKKKNKSKKLLKS